MNRNKELIPSLYVIIAALLWGSNGIFVNLLADSGLNSFERTSARMIFAAIIETVIFVLSSSKQIPKAKDAFLFFLAGAFGMFGFVSTYTLCISRVGMGLAAVLIYLMPTIVMIYSCIWSDEKFTMMKMLALLANLIGCGLVSNIFSDARSDIAGIVFGIVSALCYSSNNIIVSRLSNYSAFSRMFYPTVSAAVCSVMYLCIFSDPSAVVSIVTGRLSYLLIICLWAICCSVCTYYLFNSALKHISVTRASIISSFELVFAVLFGVFLFSEPFGMANLLGVVLVILSIVCMERR